MPPRLHQSSRAIARTVLRLGNLGPRCAEWLAEIGIHDENDLRSIGAAAYRALVNRGTVRPNRMLLYALGGALLDMNCGKLTRDIKRELEEEEAGVRGAPVGPTMLSPHRHYFPNAFRTRFSALIVPLTALWRS